MRLMAMTIALCAASAACAQNMPSGQLPNPAIVRIIAPERDGVSYGSGALVAVNDTYGLVVTNWHVVRDAAAPVWVAFPNGFRSAATILKTDRDWDLAALAVWRTNVSPLPLATQPPRPGERLTIAGYGSGSFRAVSGQCTQYVSPGGNNPFEMIELSAPARNGDSGGPILNDRGEIAGVLFGSAYGQTTGSYCGRLRFFLSSAADDFQRLPAQPAAIAQQQSTPRVPLAAIAAQPSSSAAASNNARASVSMENIPSSNGNISKITPVSTAISAKLPPSSIPIESSMAGMSWFEQIRNYLAVIGILAVLIQVLRVARKLAV
jgi:S1-C subfamily serine protease